VYGPAGCGKTRLIKKMCRIGVFYYQANPGFDFADGLAEAVGLKTGCVLVIRLLVLLLSTSLDGSTVFF